MEPRQGEWSCRRFNKRMCFHMYLCQPSLSPVNEDDHPPSRLLKGCFSSPLCCCSLTGGHVGPGLTHTTHQEVAHSSVLHPAHADLLQTGVCTVWMELLQFVLFIQNPCLILIYWPSGRQYSIRAYCHYMSINPIIPSESPRQRSIFLIKSPI